MKVLKVFKPAIKRFCVLNIGNNYDLYSKVHCIIELDKLTIKFNNYYIVGQLNKYCIKLHINRLILVFYTTKLGILE